MSRTRQDLARLQAMCKEYSKVIPKEWPENLIGVGPDMRRWVKSQDDAVVKPKTSVKKNGKKQESKPVKESE